MLDEGFFRQSVNNRYKYLNCSGNFRLGMAPRFYKKIFVWSVALFIATGGQALANTESPKSSLAVNSSKAKSTSHLDLSVGQMGFAATDYVSNKEIKFMDVCAEFSKLMVNNRGLWGTGPFRKVTCLSEAIPLSQTPKSWRLQISGDAANKKFEIFFIDAAGVAQLESTLAVETELSPVALLSVRRTRAMIAAHLSLGLPFRSILPKSQMIQDGVIRMKGFQLTDLPPPDSNLQIFSLNRSRGLWLPKVLATAELNLESGGPLLYKISLFEPSSGNAARGRPAAGVFYLQHSEGRDEARVRIDNALKQDLSGFLRKLIGFARSVYIGGRYGQPLGRSKGILSQAATVGAFGEFRGGLFQGVKFNYDIIPKLSYKADSVEQEFSWSRMQLGYGFGRRFNNLLFNWIDLTPKIGVTSLQYAQEPSDLTGDLGFEFKLAKAPTLGAEIGIEKRTPLFLARLWTSGSYSVGVAEKDKNYKSSSVRVGFDVYRDLFSLGSIKVAILAFGAGDTSTFTRSVSDQELEEDPGIVTNLKYQSVYAGGGLTLTW